MEVLYQTFGLGFILEIVWGGPEGLSLTQEKGIVVGGVSVEFHGGMFYLDFGLLSFAFP